jgi:GH25 family lysozyme M1 (1,4-beta-N-acetylmuramidase)
MLKGIDVSKWQGAIDWNSVSKNQNFAIIRSSYGVGYKDEKFEYNRDEARRLKMLHGFYHYAYPNHNEPEAEADWFLSVVSPLQDGELLVLDFEENYPDPVGWSKRFLERISERLNGYLPLLYINYYTTKTYNWKPVADGGFGLWLAKWDYDPDGTFEVPYWSVVAMRQYSNNEVVNGISGRVDGNVFYGGVDQFLAYGVRKDDQPCEQLKEELQQVGLDLNAANEEVASLTKSLSDLNGLYKKLLEDGKLTQAKVRDLTLSLDNITKLYNAEKDKVFEKDKELLKVTDLNSYLTGENRRLRSQKFTFREAVAFLFRSFKGGDS